MSVDTSREAVERLAELWDHTRAAATLRALLAERDAAHLDVARWRDECERLRLGGCARGQTTTQWCAEAVEMMAQRDAARASVAAAYRAGAEAMRELAAADTDCGCASRADVLAALAEHGERRARRVCAHMDACLALQAAAIRALPLPEPEGK